jgi:2-polyprenyl-3-methyl-5-hydroxy-6-metoxy-1,4-benzoquinol methylase
MPVALNKLRRKISAYVYFKDENVLPYELQRKRYKHILPFLKRFKTSRVLDVGCQLGDSSWLITQLGHNVYGIEIDKQCVEAAKIKYPMLNIQWGDCEDRIPFEDKYFDIVWAGDVIEHIRFTDVFINEINRVLKVSGLFVLTTPMHNKIKNLLIALAGFEKHYNPEFSHYRFYTKKSLKNVLEIRGFNIRLIKYIGRIPPIAETMFVIAEKIEDKMVKGEHPY